MRSLAQQPGIGLRRYDRSASIAANYAEQFTGLPETVSHAKALATFKRAAIYKRIPLSVVQLIDVLFSWTKADDWRPAQLPVVWPRNDKLARALGISVRQVQNLLDAAVKFGLVTHKDSPNGHRGGVRSDDGTIKWAYGIVLSPIGSRYREFADIAERGARDDAAIDGLKRRLSAARRHIRVLAQTVVTRQLTGTTSVEDYDLALMAARQMRAMRDVGLFTACVEQIEARASALECQIATLLDPVNGLDKAIDISCTDDAECTHSTTTNQLQPAKAVTCRGSAERSSGDSFAKTATATTVEADLDTHGVDPAFIESVTPELHLTLGFEEPSWGGLVNLAERLVDQTEIHRHAWREACRMMGERGAAAGVIATVYKYRSGEVRRPGAYLRGMSARAQKGELNLGRTFHGLKDQANGSAMRSMHDGFDASSAGELARRAIRGLIDRRHA